MINKIDDVEFTRKVLDDLATTANIDSKRVFATGMSNGGIMSYRLASELSDQIAAIAPVGGPMGTDTCKPKRPVSVIHLHGTDDEPAPFKGSKGKGKNKAAVAPNPTGAKPEFQITAPYGGVGSKPPQRPGHKAITKHRPPIQNVAQCRQQQLATSSMAAPSNAI